METRELRGCLPAELRDVCLEAGLKPFRGDQVFQWVQQKAAQTWEDMKNISQNDRQILAARLNLHPSEKIREQQSADGTRKYLFRLRDGETIESVLMAYERTGSRDRRTVCVSTQVGCAVGCAFCATGQDGFRRNLSAGEIVGQVLDITSRMRREDAGFSVTNVVFMGMGEPFFNYEQVLAGINLLNQEQGMWIGKRRMTVSTCGVAPRIVDLAKDDPQVGLAVSLHAVRDEERDCFVPLNRRYPLNQLLDACRAYTDMTRRRITFEYALTGSNAEIEEAKALAELLKGQLGHVNLIPVNPVTGSAWKSPRPSQIKAFARILEEAGIPVSVREGRGADIEAACGQLRRQWEGE